jgi:4-cresol dehydrogenase (hydroxylating)
LHGKIDRLQFISTRKLRMLRAIEGPYRVLTGKNDLTRAARLLPPLFSVLQGTPTDGFLASAYWRKKTPPPKHIDPDADKCGLLWCSPVAPNTGTDVTIVVDMATSTALDHGFEPIISVSLLSERMTISTIALTYDREVPGEDDRAMACYRSLTERLVEQGYPPYRLNVASMNYATGGSDHDAVLRTIKSALDPNGVIAPGRYDATVSTRTAAGGGASDRKVK